MTQATIQMTPGDDTHLTLLMAPQSLNFVTGRDREHLLAFGRAAFEAGQSSKCLLQIAEPATRFCPECGHVGDVGAGHRDCCPDGSSAFNVPAKWANDLRAGFKAQLAAAPQAVQPAVPVYSPNNPAPLRREGESIRDYRVRCGWDHHTHPAEGVPAQADGEASLPYFSYDSDSGVEFHATLEEAIKWCDEALDYYRGESADGWPEEAESIKWGHVLGRAVQCNVQPIENHPEFTESCDYELTPYATQPAAQGLDAQDAECLEIGRELCRACAELPLGYEIILYLAQGSGTVHWMDTDGNEHDIGEDGVFSEKIGYAIAAAQAKQGEQENG